MSADCQIQVSFHQPPVNLRHYFTSFYLIEITVAGQGTVEDCIHPEWGGLRMISGSLPEGSILGGREFGDIAHIGQGPTSTTIRYRIGSARLWGVGLLPAGWAKFVSVPANTMSNVVCDATTHEAFSAIAPLAGKVFGPQPDPVAELARIGEHFLSLAGRPCPDEARITGIHTALIDPDIANVQELGEASVIKAHTLERLCRRHFGFPPSLLLRRQRFMRSLVQYVMDPSLKWVGAIDPHYHDQAQFVRDFHHFMGMSPREYAAGRHPIVNAMMRARTAATGAAVQALHPPVGVC